MTEKTTGVSRRRVMQGAAWATPAIMLAVASPATASSTGLTVTGGITTGRSNEVNLNANVPRNVTSLSLSLVWTVTSPATITGVSISGWTYVSGALGNMQFTRSVTAGTGATVDVPLVAVFTYASGTGASPMDVTFQLTSTPSYPSWSNTFKVKRP
ncbi:hypothetical protein Lsed01_00660 [Demequina sediminis]|uniref:Uncharacterized protein n=1 Tax=Demequina sediminis TaxID=1930058 RepID=A0ABP9WG88_9MICO